ncbi:MAG: Cdc6/Cdc18 family protein, partial [bacterium]
DLHRTGRDIKQLRVFDFNYIPERPLMRPEVKPVTDALLRYAATGIPNHLLLFGSRGCGKTLMVKYLANLLADQGLRFCYVNCRQHNTSFKILAHLLGVRPRGHSLDELWQRFCGSYSGRVAVILDEVDLISDRDRNKELLYLFSRSSAGYMAVLLSNNPRFLRGLDQSIRSTLQPHVVHFRNYDANEIQRILTDRARAGLADPPYSQLPQIAALTTKYTNSDVRVAIKTLYYLALEPEAQLEELFNRASRDLVRDVLADLNDRNLLILKAAADISEEQPLVKAVYRRYRQLSLQLHEQPFSYVYFYSNLSYLQSVGLILLVSTKVRRSYTNRIQLLFQPQVLRAIWRQRFA